MGRSLMAWVKTIVLCAIGAVAQDDAATVASSLLVARGDIDLIPALIGCYLGTAGGDFLMIAIGALVGRRALRWNYLRRRLDEGRLNRLSQWMTETHRGSSMVFLSRFLAGLRTIVHLAIGMLHVGWARIIPLVLVAGAIYVGIVFALVVGVGATVQTRIEGSGLWFACLMLLVGMAACLAMRMFGRWIARSSAPSEITGIATASRVENASEAADPVATGNRKTMEGI